MVQGDHPHTRHQKHSLIDAPRQSERTKLLRATIIAAIITSLRHRLAILIVARFPSRLSRYSQVSYSHMPTGRFVVGRLPESLYLRSCADRAQVRPKNFIDLGRYLLPLSVPQRWRRRMIALGSGDPTRLICSTLIAQAFMKVGHPILPTITLTESEHARKEIFHIRDSSLYTPRDFDISPFFAVLKPTIEVGFDYKKIVWCHEPDAIGGKSFLTGSECNRVRGFLCLFGRSRVVGAQSKSAPQRRA